MISDVGWFIQLQFQARPMQESIKNINAQIWMQKSTYVCPVVPMHSSTGHFIFSVTYNARFYSSYNKEVIVGEVESSHYGAMKGYNKCKNDQFFFYNAHMQHKNLEKTTEIINFWTNISYTLKHMNELLFAYYKRNLLSLYSFNFLQGIHKI